MNALENAFVQQCVDAADPSVAATRSYRTTDIYDGAELRRLSNRPGAYDALALPSRGNSRERTLRKDPTPA